MNTFSKYLLMYLYLNTFKKNILQNGCMVDSTTFYDGENTPNKCNIRKKSTFNKCIHISTAWFAVISLPNKTFVYPKMFYSANRVASINS